jgi:C1A family cysteine protease
MRRSILLLTCVFCLLAAAVSPARPVYSSAAALNSYGDGDLELAWQVGGSALADASFGLQPGDNQLEVLQHWLQALVKDPAVIVQVKLSGKAGGQPIYQYSLAGNGGLGQFKKVVYQDLSALVHIPGGPVDLRVETKLGKAQPVEILLDSNYSTGYRWLVAEEQQQAYLHLEDRALPQTNLADGQAQRQLLDLTAAVEMDNLALVYRRSWEPAQADVTITLQIHELPPVLDLSNPYLPTPTSPVRPVFTPIGPQQPNEIETLPAAFDWRTTQKVTPIRDQGGCGSCWAFSVVGSMESAMLIAGDGTPASLNLSEQYLVSCNTYGENCEQGGFYDAHNFHYDTNGLANNPPGAVLESAFPYNGNDGSCTQVYNHPYKLTGWHYLNSTQPSPAEIKQAIYDHGPVSASVCVGSAFQAYRGGIFVTDESSNCTSSNHAVVLVGWDDNGGNGYWIVKNSWNTWWGESGYMRIRWGISRIGIYANYVTYASANNPIPVISQINPPLVYKGGPGFNLVVTGSGFVANSKVRWNGTDRATTFVNAGKVKAAILASDIANLGTANITVFNSTPGGGTSNQAAIQIVDPASMNKSIFLPTIRSQ